MLVMVMGSWLVSYRIIHKDKRRLLTGYVFNLSIVITIGYIVILCIPFSTPLPILLSLIIGLMAFVLTVFWRLCPDCLPPVECSYRLEKREPLVSATC
jgi:hypothetical protein